MPCVEILVKYINLDISSINKVHNYLYYCDSHQYQVNLGLYRMAILHYTSLYNMIMQPLLKYSLSTMLV